MNTLSPDHSKIRNYLLIFLCGILISCSHNNRQKEIINKILLDNQDIYSSTFENLVSNEFDIQELKKLAYSKNPKNKIYFYKYLLKNHPNFCFAICLDHLIDSTRLLVSTSYDTQRYLTIGNLMIAEAREKHVFSVQENKTLDSIIVTHVKEYNHLEDQFYYYLHKNEKTPRVEFYEIIRDLVIEKKQNNYFSQISLINYFSNYKNKADDKIIKDYLLNSIKKDKTIYFNSTLEFIANNPNSGNFEILSNFYAENIQNKLTRCDECFFELKLFCEAISKFKNDQSKFILNSLIASEKYYSSCNYLAKNEQFYKLLTNSDTNFYKQLIENIEPKLNNKILMEVEKYGK